MHRIKDIRAQPAGFAVDQQPHRAMLLEQGDDLALWRLTLGRRNGRQALVKTRGVALKQIA